MEEGSSRACLLAVIRLQHFGDNSPRSTMEASENEFVARVGVDGRYTYVDPRVVRVLGYLLQDLIGQVSYEYYHPEDIQKMVQLHHDGEGGGGRARSLLVGRGGRSYFVCSTYVKVFMYTCTCTCT